MIDNSGHIPQDVLKELSRECLAIEMAGGASTIIITDGTKPISWKQALNRAMSFYRQMFRGKAEVQATLTISDEEKNLFPILEGFEFAVVTRVRGKLKVSFD